MLRLARHAKPSDHDWQTHRICPWWAAFGNRQAPGGAKGRALLLQCALHAKGNAVPLHQATVAAFATEVALFPGAIAIASAPVRASMQTSAAAEGAPASGI